MTKTKKLYVPITNMGVACTWLESDNINTAWTSLMQDFSFMPYRDRQDFKNNGFDVVWYNRGECQ